MNNGGVAHGCQVSGKVSGESTVGGLIGCNMGAISECRATGKVSGNCRIGGLVGANTSGNLADCYASCKVLGKTYDIGGLVGANTEGSLNNCHATGKVLGNDGVGGLVGSDNNGKFSQCYWDMQTTGQQTSSAGRSITPQEMKCPSTFAGWDLDNIWQIEGGKSYPTLRCFNRNASPIGESE